jgi:serine/threonine protein phosphatase PrpC
VRLDRDIRAAVPDGSTAGVVVLKKAPDGAPASTRLGVVCAPFSLFDPTTHAPGTGTTGGVGVKCAWVGDSRVVLVRYDALGKTAGVAALSRDHKATDPTESARIEAFYAALSRTGGEAGSEDSTHGGARGGSGHDQRQVLTSAMVGGHFGAKGSADPGGGAGGGGGTPGKASQEGGGSSQGAGHTMEEEVSDAFEALCQFDPTKLGLNVTTTAAGDLIVNLPPRKPAAGGIKRSSSAGAQLDSVRSGAPAPAPRKPGGGAAGDDSDEGSSADKASQENSRHGPAELSQVRVPAPPPAKSAAPPPPSSQPPPQPPGGTKLSAEALAAAIKTAAESESRQRRSFVARLRDPETGAMSTPRLFGGNVGASTAMTRSIGDRGAARCCIAEPEFCTMLVAPGERGRVILASDGMWDVYTNEEADTIARGTRMDGVRTSADAAALLARRAQEDRSFDGLSPDDITIIVLDINKGGLPGGGKAASGGAAPAGGGDAQGGCCTLQ